MIYRQAPNWTYRRRSLVPPITYSWGVAKLHYSTAIRFHIMRQHNSELGECHGLERRHSAEAVRGLLLHAPGYCRERRYKTFSYWRKSLLRTDRSPAGNRCPRAGQMGTPHASRLAVRSLHRLFRNHVVLLFRLAPAAHGRRSLRGSRGAARGPASLDTGSVGLSSGRILWRKRGADGSSHC